MTTCGSCGSENPGGNRFCGRCGAPLDPAGVDREVRKTVTVVFADVTGSTELGEKLDPESMRKVMSRYFDAMKSALEHHGGTVEKFIGDAVMAVFGVPQVHEDDALRALRATADMDDALGRLNEDLERTWRVRLQMRVGVNTGEVVAGTGQTLVTGDAVNVAARLQGAAEPGEVLIGAATYQLTKGAVLAEPVDPLQLKGKSTATAAYRLQRVEAEAGAIPRHLDSPLVARDREMLLLRQAFDRAVEDRATHLFTVLGSAGVGKSRLVREFLTSAQHNAALHVGRCLAYGAGITFWPVAEIVHSITGIEEFDAPDEARAKIRASVAEEPDADEIAARVAEAIGLAEGLSVPHETFWGIRRFFEAHGTSRPQVLVFDDVHWAEPTLLDLLEHIADWSRDAPIMMLCIARPELLDARPNWGGGKLNATSILLEPLSAKEAEQLATNLLGTAELDPAIAERIAAVAEGNPLFVEEMLGMLIDDGLLRREDGRWRVTSDVSEIAIPPTIRALLSARLDRLQGPERDVIERASVVGKVFYTGAVCELSIDRADLDVPASLMTLVRKELIRPERSTFVGEEAFRFRHILIRDAAYESMPKETRADLHERFAHWLKQVAGERLAEYEEIVGHHLEEAHTLRVQLGGAPASDLALDAARHLASAAARARNRGDATAAQKLYDRAIRVWKHVDDGWLELAGHYADVLWEAGQMSAAGEFIRGADEVARERGDERTRAFIALVHADVQATSNPELFDLAATTELIERSIDVFERSHDHLGLARAYQQHGVLSAMQAQWGPMEAPMMRSLEEARRAGNPALENRALEWLSHSIYFGPTPIPIAVERLGSLASEARSVVRKAEIEAKAGAAKAGLGLFAEAQTAIDAAIATFEEFGQEYLIAGLPFFSYVIPFWQGDLDRTIEVLSEGARRFIEGGGKAFASTMLTLRADMRFRQGDLDGALRDAHEGQSLSAPDDAITTCGALAVIAKVKASEGDTATALEHAERAISVVETTDHIEMHAYMYWDLAEVKRRLGDPTGAMQAARAARARFERKGHALGVRAMDGTLRELR